jgi:hypothetical protein
MNSEQICNQKGKWLLVVVPDLELPRPMTFSFGVTWDEILQSKVGCPLAVSTLLRDSRCRFLREGGGRLPALLYLRKALQANRFQTWSNLCIHKEIVLRLQFHNSGD